MDPGMAPRLDEDGFPVKEAFPNVHNIYNREAKTYDTAMVERWKTTMEGLLIFAGLFSAAVTAFIIEGYKSLKPDTGDLTVILLYQISQQMALAANRTQISPSFLLPPPSQVPFSAPWTAVASNMLWFISLGLSLACAVAATLVQQWARNYIHTVERRPSAERRARMRMYLFEGVKKFNMTQIVDGVPALLHLALFTFLLGLVFFIQTINWPVTATAIAIFVISVASYLYATFLPLVAPQSPIQTPLTSVLWRQSVFRVVYWTSPRISFAAGVTITAAEYTSTQILRQLQRCFRPIKRLSTATWTVMDLVVRRGKWSSKPLLPLWQKLSARAGLRERWLDIKKHWCYDEFGSLNIVRVAAARDTTTEAFKQREKEAFTWLVKCLDEDREILPFMEAMPAFIRQATRNHDAQATFSHIFCLPRLALYTRLPDLLRRYWQNARIQAAFAEFHLSVDEKDWKYILSTFVTPEHLWPRQFFPSWNYILGVCSPDIRAQLHKLQSTIEFCWISTGHPWFSLTQGETYCDQWWPAEVESAWNKMMQKLSSPPRHVPSYTLPTLSFTKVLLNSPLADDNSTALERILCDYLPFSLSWFSESSTAEEQQSYCAILATIVSALEARTYSSYAGIAFQQLLLQCRNISDSTSLRDLDQLLQGMWWFQGGSYSSTAREIVAARINKLDDTGRPVWSQQVIMNYRASNYAEGMSSEPLSLRYTSAGVQSAFITQCQSYYGWFQFDFVQSPIDPETEIPEAVLFIESAIDVFYTMDDMFALQHALDLLSFFLYYYPYNEGALACRDYLEKTICQKALLISVYDRTMTVVGTGPIEQTPLMALDLA